MRSAVSRMSRVFKPPGTRSPLGSCRQCDSSTAVFNASIQVGSTGPSITNQCLQRDMTINAPSPSFTPCVKLWRCLQISEENWHNLNDVKKIVSKIVKFVTFSPLVFLIPRPSVKIDENYSLRLGPWENIFITCLLILQA